MKLLPELPQEVYLKCSVVEYLKYAKKEWLTVKLPNGQVLTISKNLFIHPDELSQQYITKEQ